jgi:hypothetical protein
MFPNRFPRSKAAALLRKHGQDAYGVAWKALEGAVGQPMREYWAKVCEEILIALEGISGQKKTGENQT